MQKLTAHPGRSESVCPQQERAAVTGASPSKWNTSRAKKRTEWKCCKAIHKHQYYTERLNECSLLCQFLHNNNNENAIGKNEYTGTLHAWRLYSTQWIPPSSPMVGDFCIGTNQKDDETLKGSIPVENPPDPHCHVVIGVKVSRDPLNVVPQGLECQRGLLLLWKGALGGLLHQVRQVVELKNGHTHTHTHTHTHIRTRTVYTYTKVCV